MTSPNGVVSICMVRLNGVRRHAMARHWTTLRPPCGRQARYYVWYMEQWRPMCAYHLKFYRDMPIRELTDDLT